MRSFEGFKARRHTAIGGGMDQDFLDFIDRHAIGQRTFDVEPQFGGLVERGQHRDVDHAARLARQAVSRPRMPPTPFRRDGLKCHHEIVGARDAAIDIIRAQHLTPNLQPTLELLALRHFQNSPDSFYFIERRNR